MRYEYALLVSRVGLLASDSCDVQRRAARDARPAPDRVRGGPAVSNVRARRSCTTPGRSPYTSYFGASVGAFGALYRAHGYAPVSTASRRGLTASACAPTCSHVASRRSCTRTSCTGPRATPPPSAERTCATRSGPSAASSTCAPRRRRLTRRRFRRGATSPHSRADGRRPPRRRASRHLNSPRCSRHPSLCT